MQETLYLISSLVRDICCNMKIMQELKPNCIINGYNPSKISKPYVNKKKIFV